MTATQSPPAERPARRRLGAGVWVPSVLLMLAPKCLLCAAGYVAAGTALRFGGAELCGAPAGVTSPWLTWLPVLGLAVGATGVWARIRRGPPAGRLQP